MTKRPRLQVLEDYRAVLASIYAPAAYFGRVRRMIERLNGGPRQHRPSLRILLRDLRAIARLVWRLPMSAPGARREFLRTALLGVLRNPRALPAVIEAGRALSASRPILALRHHPDGSSDRRDQSGHLAGSEPVPAMRGGAVDRPEANGFARLQGLPKMR